MILLILNGAPESGKGEVINILSSNYSVYRYSSIEWAKNIMRKHFGWNGKKNSKSRDVLASLKQLGIKYGDIPFNETLKKLEMAEEQNFDFFITEIREPKEMIKLVKYCYGLIDCYTVCVHNERAEKKLKKSKITNSSDFAFDKYDYNYHIYNNGTLEELHHKVLEMAKEIR